jgi:hypothetical protein
VTEPELPAFAGDRLRAFPDALPEDAINATIDETFVPRAPQALPDTADAFRAWRTDRLAELRRLVFRPWPARVETPERIVLSGEAMAGRLESEPGVATSWRYFPAPAGSAGSVRWLVVLNEDETLEAKPAWLTRFAGDDAILLVAPRGTGPNRWADPAPFYVQRALALLGRTVDGDRVRDVLTLSAAVLAARSDDLIRWRIAGRGRAGVIAAYAALFEPRVAEIMLVEPPTSHREGPIFLNVLRVLDIPQALGLLAPRPLTVHTGQAQVFASTAALYRVAGGPLTMTAVP